MAYSTHVFRLGPLDIELVEDPIDDGYILRVFVYPVGWSSDRSSELASKGVHDLSFTFHYHGDDGDETYSVGFPLDLNPAFESALSQVDSGEDLYRVTATLTLFSTEGPTIEYNFSRSRLGDSWMLWSTGTLILTSKISRSAGKQMIQKLGGDRRDS